VRPEGLDNLYIVVTCSCQRAVNKVTNLNLVYSNTLEYINKSVMDSSFHLLRTHIILLYLSEGNFALQTRYMDVAEEVVDGQCWGGGVLFWRVSEKNSCLCQRTKRNKLYYSGTRYLKRVEGKQNITAYK
jgi:hypothetical protein